MSRADLMDSSNYQAIDSNAYQICTLLRAADLNGYWIRKPLTVLIVSNRFLPHLWPECFCISQFVPFLVIIKKL